MTKASTKPDKSLDNNIIFNEFPLINETTFVSNYFKENSSQNCYEKLKQNLMPKKQFLNKKKNLNYFMLAIVNFQMIIFKEDAKL